jgi:hypothetical protein
VLLLGTVLQVLKCQEGTGATKLLVELQDGLQVEAVVMHYDTTGQGPHSKVHSMAQHNRQSMHAFTLKQTRLRTLVWFEPEATYAAAAPAF